MGTLKTFATGNLAADPEGKYTPNGKFVCEFRVAVNVGYGEYAYTEYLSCVAWDKSGEFINKHFGKGNGIVLELQQKTESWEDKQTGEKRYRTKYRVVDSGFPPAAGERRSVESEAPARNTPQPVANDDSLPF